ncbi:MAG TPA: RHS repeat-associated core domain-containing protein, partial [Longimicrobium sp.]|nr:RHS repeat-associated core domain-containing protein [Longimicrobium sp.]
PYRGYAATAADDAFSAWGAGDPPPSSGWAEQRTVLARDGWGLALEARGTAGVRSSWIHDTAGMVPLAAFTNTARADASYYDFEPYAAPGAWAWSAAGSTLAAHVTTADYHTGSRSLELPPTPGEKAGPLLQWIPADQAARYLFSCWAATDAGFDPAQGAAAWEIGVYRGDTGARLATLDLALGATAGAWAPFQRVIDLGGVRAAAGSGLPAAVPLQVRLLGYNANASVACRVDNLRVSRLDAAFAAAVYDARTLRPLSTLGANGDTLTTVYDGQGRAVASVGPGERVNRVWAPSLSRQLTRADRFLPDFPNSLLRLATSARSAWKDFRAAGAAREWSFGGTGSWSVAGGELKHTGAAGGLPLGGTATFTAWAMTSFALRVTARRDGAGNAGAGNGDVIVYWDDAAGAWTLARRAGDGTVTTVSTSTALGWRGDWVYAVVDGLVLFYAGGVQLFAYDGAPDTAAPDYGKPLLVMSGTGAFDDVAILDDPQLTLDFSTGTGLPFQGVALEGRSAPYPAAGDFRSVSGGVFVDALGRVAAGRRPLSVPLVIAPPTTGGLPALPGGFGGEEPSDGSGGGGDDATALELVEGGALTYLAAPDGTPWSKATYLAGGYGGGYDYVQPTYESSPLSRVVELLLPRAQAADPASARYTTAYLCNTAAGDGSVMNDLLPPGTPDGRYFITRSTGPDGTRRWELADAAGRALAARVDLGAGTYLTTGWAYDDAGRVTAILPPNHYAEADAARKAEWDTTLEYDFQARLTATTSPDAGETRFLYDASGVLRFRMDAEGAAQSPQRVVYRRLDALGRVVEEGWIAQPWSALAAHVDDPAWPTVGTGAGEVPGAWTRRMTYDWTGTTPPDGLPDEPNLVGRLWRVRVARGESAFTETYAYDAAGNVVEHLAAEGDATAQRTSYLYDNQDRLQRLTYPRADGSPDGDAVRVAYFYDRLARLASIGRPPAGTEVIDPENPATGDEQAYAAYTYDRMGRLVRETLAAGWSKPFTRAYGYTQAGFLSRIDDPFLAQALDYTGGADGAGYHDGRIARLSTAYPPEGWELCPPADWDVRLAYDAAGRLTAARNGASDAWSWAAPGPDAYDANGNPLTLRRGAAQQSFAYPAGSAKRGNRVLSLTATADTTLPLAGGAPAPADAWWWGSGNGGPSASAVAQDGEKGTVLRLAGGSPGHFETVRLRSWLDPAGRYTVTCSVRTDAGFGAAPGSAAWMLSVESPSRPAATIRVGTVADTAGAWSDVSFEVDVAARLAELAPGAEAGSITLQLVNYRTSATGSGAGPGLEVTPIRVRSTAPVQGGDIGYDRDGRTTALPSRGLSTLSYDAVSGLTTGLALAGGQTLELAYGGRGQRTAKTLRDRAGAALATTTWAYGADARPLAQQGEDTELRYLYGPGGVVAVLQGDAAGFVLRDHLGSVRGMVDPAAGTATAARDYLVFGGAMRSRGDVPGGRLFTGQPLDAETGLYDYGARFYDPALGRFLATDPAGEGAGPYTYAGNDPVAFTDPDGEMRLFYLGALGAGVAVGLGGAVGAARLWWQYVTAPAAMAFREAAERIPTGAGLYSNATRAALDLSAAELGIEPLPVRPDSTFTDYLKGKTYDPANFAAYRVTGGAGGLALQNGTRLADGRYIYTLDENYELRMLRGEPPPQNGTKWEQLRSHPQLSGGKRVILAGWAQVENGEITGMDVASGHYQPLALYLSFAREVLRALGIRAGRLRLCTFENSLQFTDKACIPAREDQCAPRQLRPEGEIEYLQPENWKVAPKVRIQRFLVTTLGYTPRQVAESWIFGWNLGPFSVRPRGGTYMQFPEEAWQLPW